jgi:hypothetical protein
MIFTDKGKRAVHNRIYFGSGTMSKTAGFAHKPEAKL